LPFHNKHYAMLSLLTKRYVIPLFNKPILHKRLIANSPEKWLSWEDDLLRNYVKHNGKKWNEFVQHCLPHRSPKQCQARWSDVLNPDLKQGPFSAEEKDRLQQAVAELGVGRWAEISKTYLPHRSARRIANVWSSMTISKKKKWSKEEDELLLQGLQAHGPSSWAKVAAEYLPWRTRMQIRNHYRTYLDPTIKQVRWTDSELDLLLRRTIVYGQNWNKVAEGLRGRTPEQCNQVWMTQLDPALNKGPWSKEETLLFWKQMVECQGNFVKVAATLPGRTRLMCSFKFWSVVKKDPEFTLLYGDQIKKERSENSPEWRTRIAKLVCEWIERGTTVREASNHSVILHRAGSWSQEELDRLEKTVNEQLENKTTVDWKEVAKEFIGRNVHQCRYQYEEHLSNKHIKKGAWSAQEDALLVSLVNKHGIGHWDNIVQEMPQRNKRQCAYRWYRELQFKTGDQDTPAIIKNKRLTETEKMLIREGVHMFGPQWHAIRMTYLPSRTPKQMMEWWHYQQQNPEGLAKRTWNEQEDQVLKFAVEKYSNEFGQVTSWSDIAKMIQGRSPKQCKSRWLYSLQPHLTKGKWSYEEELKLLDIVQKHKLQHTENIWPLVANELNTGRSEWACRSKYNYMQRKGNRFAF
ncbi:Myb-like DNA-binding domain protein, partial [Rhizopus stolonifer]